MVLADMSIAYMIPAPVMTPNSIDFSFRSSEFTCRDMFCQELVQNLQGTIVRSVSVAFVVDAKLE